MREHFISCDWGTTSFRLRLIQIPSLEVLYTLEDVELGFGNTSSNQSLYPQQFESHISKLLEISGLNKIPEIILSGMASSSIGIKNLPYGKLPLALDDIKIPYEVLSDQYLSAYLISGLATEEDVMRGEEVQVLGAVQKMPVSEKDYLVILPGTHSKHVHISKRMVQDFKTYLTGELFFLLQTYSILRHSVKREKTNLQEPAIHSAFVTGVQKSSSSLLHEVFSIRARQILQQTDPATNYAFLSGLLIGSELNEVDASSTEDIILCADKPLADFYELAMRTLHPDVVLHVISTEEATILGHFQLLQQIHRT